MLNYCTLKVTPRFDDYRKGVPPIATFNNITLDRAMSIKDSYEMRSMFEHIVMERTSALINEFYLEFTITGTL